MLTMKYNLKNFAVFSQIILKLKFSMKIVVILNSTHKEGLVLVF